jgi:hypothetical protein
MTMSSGANARAITVDPPASAAIQRQKGEHWVTDRPKGFQNPWPSAAPFVVRGEGCGGTGSWPGAAADCREHGRF